MKKASEIFNDLPDGSKFADGSILDNYPDDIRQYDKDPRSPFYDEANDHEHVECDGCPKKLYSDETFAADDGLKYCGDCIAAGFSDTLATGLDVVFKGGNKFEIVRQN